MQNNFTKNNVNFPHLAERLSLIIIVTFGETLVNVTRYFTGSLFSLMPLLIFVLVAALFGFYVVEYECLMNHHQRSRGFVAMYSHVFMIIALLTMTAGLNYLAKAELSRFYLWLLLLISIAVYLFCVLSNSIYNKKQNRLGRADLGWIGFILIMGAAISLAFRQSNLGLIVGFTLVSIADLIYLFSKRS